jgi:hypothetical protein
MKKRLDLASVSRLPSMTGATASHGIPCNEVNLDSHDVSGFELPSRDTAEEQRPGGACTSGGGLLMIAMMQAADEGHPDDLPRPARPAFDHPESRRLLLQGIMNAIVVVIVEVISKQPTELGARSPILTTNVGGPARRDDRKGSTGVSDSCA